jgi:tetratricopeptide (TPR) repeat protein
LLTICDYRSFIAGFIIQVLIGVGLNGTAQSYLQVNDKKADSLEQLLTGATGVERVHLLNEMAYMVAWLRPDRADRLLDEASALAEKTGDKLATGITNLTRGYCYMLHGESGKASDQLFRSLEIFEELGEKSWTVKAYHYISTNLFFSASSAEDLYMYGHKALDLYRELGDSNAVAGLYVAFSGAYGVVHHMPEKGMPWSIKFLNIAELVDISNIERGVGYAIAGDLYFKMGNPKECFRLYRKALTCYDTSVVEEHALTAQQTGAMGIYFSSLGLHDSALVYSQKAIELARPITYIFGICMNAYRMGVNYEVLKDTTRAIEAYQASIEAGLKCIQYGSWYEKPEYRKFMGLSHETFHPASPDYKRYMAGVQLVMAYNKLSGLYQSLGRDQEALAAFKKVLAFQDSVNTFERQRELREVQARYETERKDQQIALLSQENQLSRFRIQQNRYSLFGLGGLVLLIGIVSILIYRQNKLRTDQRTIVLEQRLLRSQMNPHFIFNALSNISNLIDKKDNTTASKYLTRFSRLVRHILDSTRSEQIELEEEIDNLENYLSLQKLRFGDKFDYQIKIDPGIDPEEVSVPPMLIQPFVENAIEHGIKPKEEKGHIDIRLKRQNGILLCEIDDDGIGREKAMANRHDRHHSMATSITRERLAALNHKLRKKVSLEIIDLKTEVGVSLGTRIRIGIPVF